MEIKIKMQGMEQATKSLKDLGDALKRFSEENRERYIKELCTSYTKEEMAGVVVDLEKQLNEMGKIANRCGDRCSELESELAVKEDLLKTVANRYDKLLLDSLRVTRIDEDINCGEEPLPFSCDEYTDALFEELEDLRERHQQDCITINQLHTTIDTLVDRYAKLREMRGL